MKGFYVYYRKSTTCSWCANALIGRPSFSSLWERAYLVKCLAEVQLRERTVLNHRLCIDFCFLVCCWIWITDSPKNIYINSTLGKRNMWRWSRTYYFCVQQIVCGTVTGLWWAAICWPEIPPNDIQHAWPSPMVAVYTLYGHQSVIEIRSQKSAENHFYCESRALYVFYRSKPEIWESVCSVFFSKCPCVCVRPGTCGKWAQSCLQQHLV